MLLLTLRRFMLLVFYNRNILIKVKYVRVVSLEKVISRFNYKIERLSKTSTISALIEN